VVSAWRRSAEAGRPGLTSPSTVARKASALRQFYGFLLDEGLREDDPSPALPRPATRRPLPKILSHADVETLFVRAEMEAESDRPAALRLLVLLELLYGSGLRATELVSLPLASVPRDAPFLTITGKGGQQRMVPVSGRARQALSRSSPTPKLPGPRSSSCAERYLSARQSQLPLPA
jgi:integrase/recombinase XerD